MTQPVGSAAAARPIVAANWKMNGMRRDGRDLAQGLARLKLAGGELACDIIVCPPVTLLFELRDVLQAAAIALGGQDCHDAEKGAHTGDISARMRRANHGETSETVARKAAAALEAGLNVILCVGESEADRDTGNALDVVGDQLKISLPVQGSTKDIVIAYEPVWAIGTGRIPNAAQIGKMHRHIREIYKATKSGDVNGLRVLYGGSVNAENASDIFSIEGVDGALVGGASLSAEKFWGICAHYGE